MENTQAIFDSVHIENVSKDNTKSLSIEVFEGYLKWTGISMLSASIISIVLFVLVNATYTTTQSLVGYSTLSRYFLKTTLLAIYESMCFVIIAVQKCDNLAPGYWCSYPVQSIQYFMFLPSKGKFTNTRDVNRLIANHTTQTKICYYFNTFQITIGNVKYSAKQIKIFCYALDGLIMCLLLIMLIVNEYRAQQRHSRLKRNMIDKFSVRITNLPSLPKYQLIIKLKQYIQKQVELYLQNNPITKYRFQIFDITSNIEGQDQELLIKQQPKSQISQNRLQSQIKNNIIMKRIDKGYTEVWMTFLTASNRKLILSMFQMNVWYLRLLLCFTKNVKQFQNKAISVQKAPHPEDIIYKNVKVTNISRLIVRLIIYVISLALLVTTTFLLLFLKRLSSVIVSSIAVLVTNAIAPSLLVWLSKYQRHALRTNQYVSNINKTAVYKFINTGLVVFLSQFKIQGLLSYFSNYFGYFTNSEFSSVTSTDWILNIGLSIVYTMILSIVMSNFKMFSNLGVYYFKLWKAQRTLKPGEEMPTIKVGDIDGYELYAQIAAVMIIILSYSYLLPILYPIGFLIFFSNYLSFSFMKKYVVFPCDSFNNFTKTASSLTLLSIILHMAIIAIIQDSRVHLYLTIVLGVFYFFRVFLMRLIMSIVHNFKRIQKIKKQNKRRQMLNIQQQQFSQLISSNQRWLSRSILKIRRQFIQKMIIKNPKMNIKYPLIFKQFLKYQRDVIKFTPQLDTGHIVGSISYYN